MPRPRKKQSFQSPENYLKQGIGFLRSAFELSFYADVLQFKTENKQQTLTYRIPLKRTWLARGLSPKVVPDELTTIHKVLSEALLWTNLGTVTFNSQLGEKGEFFAPNHAAYQANWLLTGTVTGETLDVFKAAMVLVLSMQIGLSSLLDVKYVRHGEAELPLKPEVGEAIASILQTAADPTLNSINDVAEHYAHTFCVTCTRFRESATLGETGYCEWARAPVPEFLGANKYNDPLWRVFVTHPRLQTGLYNPEEREEATQQYRDRVAQWFDEEDQVVIDPITLHLVEDMLNAAKSEDELQDTDTVLPRALRLMDFWHSGYLPPSNESQSDNPALLTALEKIPDALLPLVLSCLTVTPPQYACIGYVPNDPIETEVAALQLGLKPMRDVLMQSIPRRVLELLASSFVIDGEQIHARFMQYLYEQASLSFDRIVMDYEDTPASWLFEPVDFHLTDVLYIQARLNAFVYDITLEAIRRMRLQENSK